MLSILSYDLYQSMLPAVEHNFQITKVMQFTCMLNSSSLCRFPPFKNELYWEDSWNKCFFKIFITLQRLKYIPLTTSESLRSCRDKNLWACSTLWAGFGTLVFRPCSSQVSSHPLYHVQANYTGKLVLIRRHGCRQTLRCTLILRM